MNLPSLLGHVIELAEIVESNPETVDRHTARFLHSRKYIGSHDRKFISRLLYGMVRFRRRIRLLVDRFAANRPSLKDPLLQHRLLTDFIAHAVAVEEFDPQEIIVNTQARWQSTFPDVELADFVYWLAKNKSLSFAEGNTVRQLADWYSFEEWMVQEWVDQFGEEETEDLLHALNAEAPITLRVNTLKGTVDQCRPELEKDGVQSVPTKYSPTGLVAAKRFNADGIRTFRDGWFEIQDEGSQIVSYLTQPPENGFVIDACSGAGGKTLAMAALMKNRGEIVAIDPDVHKLRELERRARRSGVDIVVTSRLGQLHPGNLLGKADAVLVDAPCSGVGTIRRNPGYKWSVTVDLVDEYSRKQLDILDGNASFVRRGGRLVYATCSLIRKENETVIEQFLRLHPEFEPAYSSSLLHGLGVDHPGDALYVKLLPHKHGTDGFFVAVLERKG
jgi:16S rRNA (cytosine(967)-C(5))-methyltransferase